MSRIKSILILVVVILLTYLYFIKREIRKIYNQLNDYNKMRSNKKIDISLFDKDIENLATSINNHIDVHIKSTTEQFNMENEIRRSIANISHDIRTPRTSIKGYIQMAKKDNLDSIQRKEYLDIAESKAKLLKEILENFFELSIIQSSEYSIDIEYLNLNNLLYEVLAQFYEEFKSKNIDPYININKEDIIVIGNKIAISRVMENLFTNLIKYSQGEETILVYIEEERAVLSVSNKVENINVEDLELLFDRFYKKDISRNSSDSSGLGLAINKKLMEHMNGSIVAYLEGDIIILKCIWELAKK